MKKTNLQLFSILACLSFVSNGCSGESLIYSLRHQVQYPETASWIVLRGLASDAIVFSYVVGAEGRVTALESEEIPAMLIQEGLVQYESEIPELECGDETHSG